MRALSLAAACAALAAACRPSPEPGAAALTHPKTSGAASKAGFKDAQEAAGALMPDQVRVIPLKTFASLEGLRVGAEVAANTSSGRVVRGVITAIGTDAVTVKVESWRDAGAAPAPAR